jgi:hypothetical protein
MRKALCCICMTEFLLIWNAEPSPSFKGVLGLRCRHILSPPKRQGIFMAKMTPMKHPDTGLTAQSYRGFSWVALLFGPIVPLLRGDWRGCLLWWPAIMAWVAMSIALDFRPGTNAIGFVFMAIYYNRLHARSLLKRGYKFAGTEEENKLAAQAAGASIA